MEIFLEIPSFPRWDKNHKKSWDLTTQELIASKKESLEWKDEHQEARSSHKSLDSINHLPLKKPTLLSYRDLTVNPSRMECFLLPNRPFPTKCITANDTTNAIAQNRKPSILLDSSLSSTPAICLSASPLLCPNILIPTASILVPWIKPPSSFTWTTEIASPSRLRQCLVAEL